MEPQPDLVAILYCWLQVVEQQLAILLPTVAVVVDLGVILQL
jgi:hypothetical protein